MACAGGNLDARRTAPTEPSNADARLTLTAITMADVLGRYRSIGKRKRSAYIWVFMRPSQVPATIPIRLPTKTMPITRSWV